MAEKQEIEGEVCGFYINSQIDEDLTVPFENLIAGIKKHFNRETDDDELYSIYIDIKKLVAVTEIFDKRFTMYIEAIGDDVKLRLMCLDPSYQLDEKMKKGVSSILFSATLTPLEYFADVLGCAKSPTLSLKSPFDKEKLCLVGVKTVSTRYEDRKKSATAVANVIRASVEGKAGNYIVYFPSYAYLEEVKEIFEKKYPKINALLKAQDENEMAFCFMLRACCVPPADIVTMYLGASGVSFHTNVIGGVLGSFPGMVMTTFLGANIRNPESPAFWKTLTLNIAWVILSGLGFWLFRKAHAEDNGGGDL
jgi:hypothetical protein